MTGTAKTEEKEFVEIYGLEVVPIPTNVAVARRDENDLIFKTIDGKFKAVVEDIKERHEKGQPVLVGTIAVETSEYLSELLKRQGVPHNVLNAKEHAREAEIIKDAGEDGAVTIATNMAGRGVDIKIDDSVRELGGLYVLGTERHESRRIDNQLRGRSGPPGRPRRDALLPLRAGRPRAPVRGRPALQHHGALQGPRRPAHGSEDPLEPDRERAEEGRGAELRRAQERPQVRRRDERAAPRDLRPAPRRARGAGPLGADQGATGCTRRSRTSSPSTRAPRSRTTGRSRSSSPPWTTLYGTGVTADELKGLDPGAIIEEFYDDALDVYNEHEREIEAIHEGLMRDLERFMVLQVVDVRWREHLENMDYLREGIHLRGMAQKDPLVEYRNEGHVMFTELNRAIHEEVLTLLFHAQIEPGDPSGNGAALPAAPNGNGGGNGVTYQHETAAGAEAMVAARRGGRAGRTSATAAARRSRRARS